MLIIEFLCFQYSLARNRLICLFCFVFLPSIEFSFIVETLSRRCNGHTLNKMPRIKWLRFQLIGNRIMNNESDKSHEWIEVEFFWLWTRGGQVRCYTNRPGIVSVANIFECGQLNKNWVNNVHNCHSAINMRYHMAPYRISNLVVVIDQWNLSLNRLI